MKKTGLFAALFAVLLMLVAVRPAFAANDLNSSEQTVYDKFVSVVDKYVSEAGLDSDHATQYKSQARAALVSVDLSSAACDEFSAVIDEVDGILSGSKTRSQLGSHATEAVAAVNKVANKYGMEVSLDSKYYATVTVTTSDGTKTTVGDTSKSVKQTGFGIGQTIVVAGASAAVLGGAFFMVRKNHMFE